MIAELTPLGAGEPKPEPVHESTRPCTGSGEGAISARLGPHPVDPSPAPSGVIVLMGGPFDGKRLRRERDDWEPVVRWAYGDASYRRTQEIDEDGRRIYAYQEPEA